jgi:CDP-diacylglycerol--glycerol-3-phosphate 3-phosphatidyltransferase
MTKSSDIRSVLAYHLTRPVVQLLARTSITPTAVTWSGFLAAICAASLVITGHLFAAGFVVLITGFLDILDGALARYTAQTTPFGAVIDSVLDRLSEAVVLLGILVLYAGEQYFAGILIVGVALIGSLLVSYIRARAEAMGLECQVGLFTRAERVIVLALGLLLSQIDYAPVTALAIIAMFSFVTVVQRVVHVGQQAREK